MKYKSEIYEVVYQDAAAMFEIGAISEIEMQEFKEMCLVQETETDCAVEKSGENVFAAS
jgi:DNA-binding transcriptional regulator YiaG